jgi:uncharacterized 2Fe-2S/4Fe-4S cluster protein (DUF4445 family)
LFPSGIADKCRAAGNTALDGAILCARDPDLLQQARELASRCIIYDAAEMPDFQERFISALAFT